MADQSDLTRPYQAPGAMSHEAIEQTISTTITGILSRQAAEALAREDGQRQVLVRQALEDQERARTQQAAQQAAQQALDAEISDARAKVTRLWRWAAAVAGMLVAIAGTIYGVGHAQATEKAETTARRVQVDGRIDTVEQDTKSIGTTLETHTGEQRAINEADTLRGVRQELMLEQLLERRGLKPRAKTQRRRAADRAVGIVPEDEPPQ